MKAAHRRCLSLAVAFFFFPQLFVTAGATLSSISVSLPLLSAAANAAFFFSTSLLRRDDDDDDDGGAALALALAFLDDLAEAEDDLAAAVARMSMV